MSWYWCLNSTTTRAVSTNTGVGGELTFINYCDTIKLGNNKCDHL